MARRKKQREEDETLVDIVEVQKEAKDFWNDNQNIILGALAALLILVGGYYAYNMFYKAPQQKAAVDEMYQAQIQFERDSFNLALNNPGGGNPGFLEIIDDYGATEAGNTAKYYAAICYLNMGAFDEALDYMKDFSPAGQITPIMKYGVIGDIYGEQNDFSGAMSNYKKAANAGENDFLVPYYLKKYAILAHKEGDSGAAKAAYEQIKKEYPKSSEALDSDRFMALFQ